MIPIAATLVIGGIIGYLGQRSRFCIVSGVRDYYLLKDSYRIKGLLGLVIGVLLSIMIFKLVGGDVSGFPMLVQMESMGFLGASIIGGLGIGFFSVLAEGCPFRQHVMAAEGSESAMTYLLGFYIGIVYFNLVTIRLLDLLLTMTS